jgi:hypothetical protein
MQTPVRFYITQSDDHAVVRSVPVAVRPDFAAGDIQASPSPAPEAETVQTPQSDLRRARVGKLVRAAARRTDLRR